jgi:phytoene synthase
VYSEIGRRVRARGAQAWDQRLIVGRAGKLAWVARGLVDACAARAFPQRGSAPRAALWTKSLLD